jgi:ABC-type amino acid transport substrate-binding protein
MRRFGFRLLPLLVVMIWLLGSLLSRAEAQPAGRVFVFLPTTSQPRALEHRLGGTADGLEVRVFGRFLDFEEAIRTQSPDAVISYSTVLRHMGKNVDYQGERGGETSDAVLVVFVGKDLAVGDLPGLTYGAVDLVGRVDLPAFVAKLLALPQPAQVVRVIKYPDLLQLLRVERADAVLVPRQALERLRESTKLDVRVLDVPSARLGYAAVSFRDSVGRSRTEKWLNALPQPAMTELGVDRFTAQGGRGQ